MSDSNVKGFKRLAGGESEAKSSGFQIGTRTQRDAIGSSGTEIYAGSFTEEYLDSLKGTDAAKVYDKMRRSEAQIAMLLSAISNPIKAATWAINPASQDAKDVLHADLVRAALFDGLDFDTFKQECLTFIAFGYSLFEIVHNVVLAHPKFGTFNGLASLGFRSQKTIQSWLLEKKTGKIISVEQWAQGDVGDHVNIPGEFLCVFTNNKEGDNYEGIAALRPMFGPYSRKNVYLKIAAIGIEKYAVGVPVGTVPKGKEKTPEFDEFKSILANYTSHQTAYIIKPEGWEIELQFGEFQADKIVELLKFENTEMVNSVVANFLALGTNGNGGAFALGQDLSDFFLAGLEAYVNVMLGAINRKIIPDLVKLNYGPQSAYPKMAVTGVSDTAGKELAEVIASLIGSKAITPDMPLEEFLRSQYKLPEKAITAATVIDPATVPAVGAAVPSGPNVQQQALNGAQVTSLVGILQNVAAGLLPREGALALIQTAFNVDATRAEAILGTAGTTFKISPELLQAARVQLSEATPARAPNAYVKQVEISKDALKLLMQTELTKLSKGMIADVSKAYATAKPADKIGAGTKIETDPEKLAAYKLKLTGELAKSAAAFLTQARGEIKGGAAVQLDESILAIMLAAPSGMGFFNALPLNIRKLIEAQASLLGDSQAADLAKIVSFQFTSSATGTEDLAAIQKDIENAVAKTVEGDNTKGMSVDAAAGDSIARVANETRLEFFFDPEVLADIESFTFENNDPVSEICSELAGTTFAANDPQVNEYTPPLHHNCKSRMVANSKGSGAPAPIEGQVKISDKARKSITL